VLTACSDRAAHERPRNFTEANAHVIQSLARIKLQEIAIYQGVKVAIMRDLREIRTRPTSVIAARSALLRVFVQPELGFSERALIARLTLRQASGEVQTFESSTAIAGASRDADLASTFNFELPATAMQSRTRYAVEISDPAAAFVATANPRFPETDFAEFAALETGPLKLRLVPVRYDADGSRRLPDLSDAQLARYREILEAMYPVSSVEISLHDAVSTRETTLAAMVNQLEQLRADEDPSGDVNYFGLVNPAETLQAYCLLSCVKGIAGFAPQSSRAGTGIGIGFTGERSAETLAHELGHILRLPHAPCGTDDAEPDFPSVHASVGDFGYDRRSRKLVDPKADGGVKDFMSYCEPSWISPFNFQRISERLVTINRVPTSRVVYESRKLRSVMITPQGDSAWGLPINPAYTARGDVESATVLDASGKILQTITIYRTQLPGAGSMLLVPDAEAGWHTLQVRGAAPIRFDAVTGIEPFARLTD
jgi:hypothetical protein